MNVLSKNIPPLPDFPRYVALHLNTVQSTKEIEHDGIALVESGFNEQLLRNFTEMVHTWGGGYYFYNLPRVLENLSSEYFASAWKDLNQPRPMVSRALDEITKIRGLGISYGSKHLRFLCPEHCPILDSVFAEKLKYPENSKGYRQLHFDFTQVARELEKNKIPNPMDRPNGRWYVADVDMAVFAYLQVKLEKPGWIEV